MSFPNEGTKAAQCLVNENERCMASYKIWTEAVRELIISIPVNVTAPYLNEKTKSLIYFLSDKQIYFSITMGSESAFLSYGYLEGSPEKYVTVRILHMDEIGNVSSAEGKKWYINNRFMRT
ncbi:MAG TPA: hypothetical protein DCZ94_19915 [Lentisphaeria bacterium]|nr:MAG: hypothetical protein A2X48_22250 [Lentisphaerae bacterium GWF2_49_21]HBC89213.1 hypothetical protein [Lentisphaeria bacterium]